MRRLRQRSVTVDVEVDLDQFETKDLVEELKYRGDEGGHKDEEELIEIHTCMRDGRIADAMSLLERLIWPKWRTPEQAQAALDATLIKSVAEQ